MTEQQPTSQQPDTVAFDPEAVGAVLGVAPAAAEDPTHGPGVRYRLGVGQALSVFPDRGVTRMRSAQVNLEIRGLPTVADSQLVYEYRGGGEQVSLHASEHAVSLYYRLGEDADATADPWAPDEPAISRTSPGVTGTQPPRHRARPSLSGASRPAGSRPLPHPDRPGRRRPAV